MSTTTNQRSLLYALRKLMPERPLNHAEALRIAELQANKLLDACKVHGAGTPSDIIASFPNIRVSKRADLPASGYTDWYKPFWHVILNAHEPQVRQRFSLFHELKHVIDHPFVSSCYPSTRMLSAERRAELVADYFAACVLMPRRVVKTEFFHGRQDIDDLAAVFDVSPLAMSYRLQQLGLIDRTPRCTHEQQAKAKLPGYFRAAWATSPPALAKV